jgi:hypothetical protein
MRRTLVTAASAAALCLSALVSTASGESTKTLRIEIPAGSGRIAIENLAGTMTIVPASGTTIVAVATIHAENDALAGEMTFEKAPGDAGATTYRVRYPYRHSTFRYPGSHASGGGFWESMFGGGSNTSTEYDDHRVKVSSSSGTLLYADVEVQIPRSPVEAKLKNVVGRIDAREVEGKLVFDSGSGDVALDRVKGEIKADTGSGDVEAVHLEGSFKCDTGSGNCDVSGFNGDLVDCDVGSGDVHLKDVTARRVTADTGSGDVHAVDIDAEEFNADTGSGDVDLSVSGGKLTRVKTATGSGDVTLRLGPDASFEVLADQGSGDIVNRYRDAEPIVKHKEVIGYRRGSALIRIDVDTGSGDLVLEPGTI